MSEDPPKIAAEQLLDDIGLLDQILKQTNSEATYEFAENCFDFYAKQSKLDAFLKWAMEKEIQKTKHYGDLFREESFGTTVLRRTMSDDVGIQFLRKMLSGICRDVLSYRKPLTMVSENSKEATENIIFLLYCVDRFLDTFAESASKCPKTLRCVLRDIQQIVSVKFPDEPSLFITNVLFFYYFCPALINPKKYGVVREYASIGVVNISKILNDLALNAVDRVKDPLINQYIRDKHPTVQKISATYIDANDIENSKILGKTASFGADEKKSSIKRFQQVINKIMGYKDEVELKLEYRLHRMSDEEATRTFTERMIHPGWKKFAEKSDYTAYSLKEPDINIVAVKSVGTIKASMELVVNGIMSTLSSKEWNPFLDSFKILYRDLNYSEYYIVLKAPFPIVNRDIALCEYLLKVNDSRTIIVHHSLPDSLLPIFPGCIRASAAVGGWNLETDTENVGHTKVTYISQFLPGGAIPAWFSNKIAKQEGKRVRTLSRLLEANNKELAKKEETK